jgi:hypothetical protein
VAMLAGRFAQGETPQSDANKLVVDQARWSCLSHDLSSSIYRSGAPGSHLEKRPTRAALTRVLCQAVFCSTFHTVDDAAHDRR